LLQGGQGNFSCYRVLVIEIELYQVASSKDKRPDKVDICSTAEAQVSDWCQWVAKSRLNTGDIGRDGRSLASTIDKSSCGLESEEHF
jgi:hypothetical protein